MGTNEYNHKGLQITNLIKYCDNLLVRSKSFHLTLQAKYRVWLRQIIKGRY